MRSRIGSALRSTFKVAFWGVHAICLLSGMIFLPADTSDATYDHGVILFLAVPAFLGIPVGIGLAPLFLLLMLLLEWIQPRGTDAVWGRLMFTLACAFNILSSYLQWFVWFPKLWAKYSRTEKEYEDYLSNLQTTRNRRGLEHR
jgi:hypothetical protein